MSAADVAAVAELLAHAVRRPAPVVCPRDGCLLANDGEACPSCEVRHRIGVEGRRRCSSCTGWFPALVDDELCIRCDAMHYPSSPALPLPPTTRVPAPVLEVA